MKWGEFKIKVEKEMGDQGCKNLDDVDIEYFDFTFDCSTIFYDKSENELKIF